MKYQIFQIRTTSEEIDAFNKTEDYAVAPKLKARRDMQFPTLVNSTVQDLAADAFFGGRAEYTFSKSLYTHVANITASDLEHVFEISNIGPETAIERLDRKHSLSVGDIVIDENNIVWVVADFGFEEVTELQVVAA